jgi:hypothetical protein
MALDPYAFSLLRKYQAQRSAGSNGNITINLDLGGLRDLWGRKQNEEEDDSLEAKSQPVHITNMPRISPS